MKEEKDLKQDDVEKNELVPIDIERNAYDISSEVFNFKDLRRGVVEHGKTCFIEGYKNHAELFGSFLVENGYFSKEELHKVWAEFDASLSKKPAISIRYAEDFLKRNVLNGKDGYLNKDQKTIVNLYKMLYNDTNTLLIQKPHQKGITSILLTIANIEAKYNNKSVLYLGHRPISEFTDIGSCKFHYRQINGMTDAYSLISKIPSSNFDLIVLDEINQFKYPYEIESILRSHLTENGRLILTVTPCSSSDNNYNSLKKYITNRLKEEKNAIVAVIEPSKEDIERAKRFPELKNEILGEFIE